MHTLATRLNKATGRNTALLFIASFGQHHSVTVVNAATNKGIATVTADCEGGYLVTSGERRNYQFPTLDAVTRALQNCDNWPTTKSTARNFSRPVLKAEA